MDEGLLLAVGPPISAHASQFSFANPQTRTDRKDYLVSVWSAGISHSNQIKDGRWKYGKASTRLPLLARVTLYLRRKYQLFRIIRWMWFWLGLMDGKTNTSKQKIISPGVLYHKNPTLKQKCNFIVDWRQLSPTRPDNWKWTKEESRMAGWTTSLMSLSRCICLK